MLHKDYNRSVQLKKILIVGLKGLGGSRKVTELI
jgi:hypothetical protein